MKSSVFWIASVIVALVAGLLTVVLLPEWWRIGVVADPEVLREYHFGTESMIAHGGSAYASAERYSAYSLISALAFLSVLIGSVTGAVLRSWRVLLGSGVALAVLFALRAA